MPTSNLNPETVLLIASICTIISALCIVISLLFVRKGINALKSANKDVIDSIGLISSASDNLEKSFSSLVKALASMEEIKKLKDKSKKSNIPIPTGPVKKEKK